MTVSLLSKFFFHPPFLYQHDKSNSDSELEKVEQPNKFLKTYDILKLSNVRSFDRMIIKLRASLKILAILFSRRKEFHFENYRTGLVLFVDITTQHSGLLSLAGARLWPHNMRPLDQPLSAIYPPI